MKNLLINRALAAKKKKLFTLLLAVAASAGTIFAWDYKRVQIDDLYYNLDVTNQTAEVTSQNSGFQRWSTTITTANIPSSVTYNSKTYSVTSIGNDAFDNCRGLTSVTIGNSVTSIGNYAFEYCTGLTSVTIPNSVTSIGNYVFSYCSGLTSVTIGNSVTSIGEGAFKACEGLTSVTIPNSVTSIGEGAFNGCYGLTSPVYNAHVFAFMPDFYSGEYTIPEGIKSIAGWSFSSCDGLTSVTIPNSVTSIGERAFRACTGLTSVTIPNSVTSIGESAFSDCSGLTSVTIGNSVTSIGWYAFYGCTSLTSVTIPNSVTSIGESAFSYCSSLTSVTIGNSVTSIGDWAFRGCTGLTSVTIEAETPPTLEERLGKAEEAFENTNNCPIYVPCNAVNAYKTEWWPYADRIVGNNCGQSGTVVSGTYKIGDLYYNLKEDKTAEVTYEWEWDESNYYGLTSANIPASVTYSGTTYSVTSIGVGAFWHCSSLASATIPNSITYIGQNAFSGCSLTTVTIPNSVTYIGGWVFEDCGITSPVYNSHVFAYMPPTYSGSYSIANGIELLSDGAFKNCTYLTSVTIPGSVTNIGRWTFEYCSGLTSVTIPNNVTSIGEGAFKDCSGLSRITIESMTPPTCGSDALSSTNACPIYVPCNAVNTYKAAWSNYANRIRGNCASYTITFKNWDGSILQSTQVEEGQMPQYTGATPTKPSDSQYSYTFSGWTPQIVAATADATYTATYTDTPRGLGVEDVLSEQVQCTKVIRDGQIFILRGDKTYTLQGQEVK